MKAWLMRLFGRSAKGPMDCHQVGELLQHYLDSELDADRASRIAAHLDDCRRCGLEAEAYEQIKSTLANRHPEVPAESVERLREFGRRLARGERPATSASAEGEVTGH